MFLKMKNTLLMVCIYIEKKEPPEGSSLHNEMQDEITDDELLHFMKEQFETICYGDLDYLEGTCLANFAQAIRAGYRGYSETDGYGEYVSLDEVSRWDRKLYLEALRELLGSARALAQAIAAGRAALARFAPSAVAAELEGLYRAGRSAGGSCRGDRPD